MQYARIKQHQARMKFQTQIVLFALAFMAVAAQESHIYCGRRLAVMIANICSDEEAVEKRASFYETGPYSQQSVHWPWIAPNRAMAMERGKRQVATECCDKPCTIEEMLAYCP